MTALRRMFPALVALAMTGLVRGQAPVPFVTGIVPSPVTDTARIWKPVDAPAQAKWAAWFCYGDARFDFRDHRSWIEDLAKRRHEQGLEVVVAMSAAAAHELAAEKPAFAVAALDLFLVAGTGAARFCLQQQGAAEAVMCEIDCAQDRIEAALAGELTRTAPGEADDLLASLLATVGDGEAPEDAVLHCVRSLPHSGQARALSVLAGWWVKGEHGNAQAAFDAAMPAINGDGVALVEFADIVLRGDPADDGMARTLAVELAPIAAAAPDGARTQRVYLRALLLAGQHRLALRVAEHAARVAGDDPMAHLHLAETLTKAREPLQFRAMADAAIAQATAGKDHLDARQWFAARHEVLARCGATPEECAKIREAYSQAVDDYRGSANNDAWHLMTDPATMGRYPAFALALADGLQQKAGETLDPIYRDTVALAAFCAGQWERAVAEQRLAVEAEGGSSRYAARLRRYEGALALRQQRETEKKRRDEARKQR